MQVDGHPDYVQLMDNYDRHVARDAALARAAVDCAPVPGFYRDPPLYDGVALTPAPGLDLVPYPYPGGSGGCKMPAAPAPAAPETRELWIGLPAYTGTLHILTLRSLFTDVLELAARGIKVHILDDSGNAMIADCRALMLAEFLESPTATHFCFIDTDVSWEAGTLLKLLDSGHDFACAIYPQRKDPIGFSVRWDQSKPELIAEAGFLPIHGCPAGFMMFTRKVVQRLTHNHGELDCWTDRIKSESFCALFDPYWTTTKLSDGRTVRIKLGEDFSFCQRWIDLGGKIHVAPEIRMGHTGNKTFIGSLGDWLREHNGNLTK